MNSHRKLLAWQVCRELTKQIYLATRSFPASERFGLTSQLRRAAISTTANLAEGFGRWGPRESAHGLSISMGSLAEIDSLFAVSEDLGHLTAEQLEALESLRAHAGRLLFGLHRKLRSSTTG